MTTGRGQRLGLSRSTPSLLNNPQGVDLEVFGQRYVAFHDQRTIDLEAGTADKDRHALGQGAGVASMNTLNSVASVNARRAEPQHC